MNKRSTRWFALLLAVAMVFSILPTAVFAEGKTQTYTKVTAAPKDWSGTYLIVSEGDSLIMDGSSRILMSRGTRSMLRSPRARSPVIMRSMLSPSHRWRAAILCSLPAESTFPVHLAGTS